jgi:hypothetical protein
MVGMDFSRAIDSTHRNTRHMPNVYLVQGDIYHPPLAEDAFDFVYSIGVLHADWFDRLAAPIRFYYSEGEVERLAQNAGISDVKVTPTGLYGWRACGIRR